MKNNVFSWPKRAAWHREIRVLLSDLLTDEVIQSFKDLPPKYVVADSSQWLDDIVERVLGEHVSVREVLACRIREHYAALTGFHGCRPSSLESYRRHGLIPFDQTRFQKEAETIFGSSKELDSAIAELRGWPSSRSSYEDHNSGKVFFVLCQEELINYCGHYLLYGSEYLSGIAGRIGKRSLLRKRGKATIIECQIPLEVISDDDIESLAGAILEDIFATLLDPEYQSNTNFGFAIQIPLPASAIIDFHFPYNIPDPLDQMIKKD